MKHWRCGAYQVCSNDDPNLTLTYLTSRSNLLPSAFKWENFRKVAKAIKPGSNSKKTDWHAADCSKAVCWGVK